MNLNSTQLKWQGEVGQSGRGRGPTHRTPPPTPWCSSVFDSALWRAVTAHIWLGWRRRAPSTRRASAAATVPGGESIVPTRWLWQEGGGRWNPCRRGRQLAFALQCALAHMALRSPGNLRLLPASRAGLPVSSPPLYPHLSPSYLTSQTCAPSYLHAWPARCLRAPYVVLLRDQNAEVQVQVSRTLRDGHRHLAV